jgi:hypothetical protein
MRIRKAAGTVVLAAAFLLAGPAAAAQAATGLTPVSYDPPPVSGDTAALMQQVNAQLDAARQLADLGNPSPDTSNLPGISPAVQDTLDMLHGLQDGDPGALADLNGLVSGMAAYGEISNDVYGYQLGLREPNGHPEY